LYPVKCNSSQTKGDNAIQCRCRYRHGHLKTKITLAISGYIRI